MNIVNSVNVLHIHTLLTVSGCLVFVGLSLVVSCGVSFLVQRNTGPDAETRDADDAASVSVDDVTPKDNAAVTSAASRVLTRLRRGRHSPQLLLIVSRLFFPAAFAVFNAVYWLRYL